MSFDVRNETPKRRRPLATSRKDGGKRPKYQERVSSKKANEDEISSESDENEDEPRTNGHHHHHDDDELEFEEREAANETLLEARHRISKEKLAKAAGGAQAGVEDESGEIDHDAIGNRLRDDGLEQAGRLQKKIADEYEPLEPTTFRNLHGHRLSPTCLRVTNDGRTIVSGSKDGAIIKWDLETGRRLHVIKHRAPDKQGDGHQGEVLALAVSSDDKFMCSGGMDSNIKIWDLRSMELLKTFTGHRGRVSGLVFRRGHNQLFSCSHDRSLKIWNLDEMGYVDTLYGHQDFIVDIDSLMRERAVTCGRRDRTARIWKVAEESQLVFHAQSGCGTIECLRLINDDHFVSGADNGLAIWSAMKKKPVCVVPRAHREWVTSVATQPFTDLVASGSWDGQVKLWRCGEDYKTLTLKHSIKVDGFVNAMAFTPDTSALVCAVGQEHRNGRWWSNKDVRNSIVVCPLTKTQNGATQNGTS